MRSLIARIGNRSSSKDARKYGTFPGVFVPTILTILGAIMYLRLGWVVGNAGLLGAIAIILLAHVITVSTGLSVSSMATNIRVGAGGAFSIISQSLGLEVGGSVSVPLFLAQAISTALYIFAFAEGWRGIFPDHPGPLVVFLSLFVVFVIAYISASLTFRIQFAILAIVIFSLVSILLGSFPSERQEGMVYTPVLIGSFPDGSFWDIFAVFFPAVTGIMAGISLSGMLKNARRSLPLGTMSAIFLAMFIYLALAYWLSRVASPLELLNNPMVMADHAFFRWAVLAGLLGATFSSALGSILAAPRVLQALGQQHVLPFSDFLAKVDRKGEPRNAMLITGCVALLATGFGLIAGGLNAIAPLVTMFFLLAYLMLNAVVLIEQLLNLVSFRPTFSISRLVPLIGVVGCFCVMFLVNALFSIVSIALAFLLYIYLNRRQLRAPWEDVRSGLFFSVARWAVERVGQLPPAPERTWSPNLLAPVRSSKALQGSYRLLWAVAAPKGSVHALGLYSSADRKHVENLASLVDTFREDDIAGRTTLLEGEDFINATRVAMEVLSSVVFRPNILFLTLLHDEKPEDLATLLEQTSDFQMGAILYAQHPLIGLGQEKVINVWLREQGPDWKLGLRIKNMDLALLLAYQLAQNWRGRINLCMAVEEEDTSQRAADYLSELSDVARMPSKTQVLIFEDGFWNALAHAPQADLNILGLQRTNPDLAFVEKTSQAVKASCIFVRDSGDESALA